MRRALPLIPLPILAIALLTLAFAGPALAAQPVKIGVLYPLSGPQASVGQALAASVQLAADVANGLHPQLPMAMARKKGIASLGGAPIQLVIVDTADDPLRAANEARRLIEEEKVAGILGCYSSSITEAVAEVCETAEMPMVTACSTDPELTHRFWTRFWRITPHDETFIAELFDFLNAIIAGKAPGVPAQSRMNMQILASACRDDAWGEANSRAIRLNAGRQGFSLGASMMYSPETCDLLTAARKLAMARPAIILVAAYEQDAVKMIRALGEIKAKPRVLWGQDAGFLAPGFEALGPAIEGVCARTVFAAPLAQRSPLAKAVNDLFRQRAGRDLDGSSARAFTGLQTWVELLELAGSTRPEDIDRAAVKLHIDGGQLILPWQGVKFEQDPEAPGQNTLGRGLIGQYQMKNGKLSFEIVYPFDMATAPLIFPFKGF